MKIRPAQTNDLEDIKACAVAAYFSYVDRIGKAPAPMVADFASDIAKQRVHVADLGQGELAGFIVFFPKPECMFLENVAIHPAYQGKGIGKALISRCEEEARLHALPFVELYTNEKMTENLSLYPRLGYVEFDRREEDGFERVYFRKPIGAAAG